MSTGSANTVGRRATAVAACIALAATMTVAGSTAATSEQSADFDDVATEADDLLTLSLVTAGIARLSGSGGLSATVDVADAASPPGFTPQPLVIESLGGNDTLVIDFSNGNPVPPDGLVFLGGDQRPDGQGDVLELVGGSSDTVTHSFINDHDGDIELDIDGRPTRIDYRGLEPVVDNISASNRVFTFTGGDETIQLTNALPSGSSFIDSSLGESVTFVNPTSSLTVTTQNGSDTVNVQGIDPAFVADVTIDGNPDTLISFASNPLDISFGKLTASGGRVDFLTNIRAGGGIEIATAGSIALTANVDLDANGPISMTADTAANGLGEFTMSPTSSMNGFAAAIDISAGGAVTIAEIATTPANLTPLTAVSTTSDVVLAGAIGVASVDVEAEGDVVLSGELSTGGAVSFDAGDDIDIAPSVRPIITGVGPVSFVAGGDVDVRVQGFTSIPPLNVDAASFLAGDGGLIVAGRASVTTTGAVTTGGNGLDAGELSVDAGSLLVSGGGLETSGAADIEVDTTAVIEQSGARFTAGVNLQAGSLTISDGGLQASGPELASITTQGDALVRGTGIAGAGSIELDVGGSLDSDDGGITNSLGSGDIDIDVSGDASVGGAGVASAGSVDFDVAGDLDARDGGFIATAGSGDITVTAGGAATIVQGGADGTGSIDVTATSDLVVEGISSTSSSVDAVRLVSLNGAILNGDDVVFPSGSTTVEVLTGGVVFDAPVGIGVPGGSGRAAIRTNVADVAATSAGDIRLIEFDGLSSLDVDAGAATVGLTADGPITDTDAAVDLSGFMAEIDTTGSLGASGAPIQTDLGSLVATSVGASFLDEADIVSVPSFDNGGSAVSLVGGSFAVNGTIVSPTRLAGGTLAGSGTIDGDVTSWASGGGIAPGTSPGIVTVDGDITLDTMTSFDVEIDGTTVGTGYDRLSVTGDGRTVTLGAAALVVAVGAALAVGDTFTIIELAASSSVLSGTFAGLDEGSAFTSDGQRFVISYVGGDGNDVVLTAVDPVPAIVPLDPARFVDTRSVGETIDDAFAAEGKRLAGTQYRVQIAGRGDVPADAIGVVVNVTAIQADGVGFVTAHPCAEPHPLTSSLNFAAGVNLGNEVIVGLDDEGFVCLFTSATTHLAGDVVGFVPAESPTTTTVPARVLDTRDSATIDGLFQGAGRTEAGATTRVRLAGRHTVPGDARTVIVNVTAVRPAQRGFVTASACLDPIPTASSLNYEAGVTRGNELVVTLDGSGDLCLFTSSSIDLTIDVMGYIDDTPTLTASTPARLLDTRAGEGTIDDVGDLDERRAAGSTLTLPVAGRGDVPADALGVVVNVTSIQADGVGFVTVDPCGDTVPVASSLNYVAGANGGNEVVARLSARGELCLFTSNSTHLVADVVAYLPA
jgi:hypothetical protein